ncbi:hypothetical protein ACWDV4_29460 [Micromonospora sp. NPDC003197]
MTMSQPGEKKAWPVTVGAVALLIGVLLCCAGLFRQPWSDEVDCGGKAMAPGDYCLSSRGGGQTYEERVEVRENGTWLLVIGLVGIAGGVLFLATSGLLGKGKDDDPQ